jgi:hypothetical protein
VAVLGPEVTKASIPVDTQNKEEGPHLSTFLFAWPFRSYNETASDVRGLKMSKNRLRASKNTFCNGKFKKYILSIFFTPKPCYSREELAGSALANARGRPGHSPILAKIDLVLAPAPPGRFRACQKRVKRF